MGLSFSLALSSPLGKRASSCPFDRLRVIMVSLSNHQSNGKVGDRLKMLGSGGFSLREKERC